MTAEDACAPSSSLRGVSKEYPAARVRALSDVDLDLSRGSLTVLLGANGAGKTTLLRIQAGLLAPSAGTVEILGIRQPAGRRSRELRRRVTYISQEPALDPEMTGGETFSLLAALYGVTRQERAHRTAELAGAFGLQSHLGRPVRIWSGGLKRRLHLAAGMIHDPELLLLDEPTAGVDPKARRDFWEQIHQLAAEGLTFLITTHYMDEAERCHRLAYIAYGSLLASGSVQEVVDGAALTTFEVQGPDLPRLAGELRTRPGVQQAVPFGTALHVSSDDGPGLRAAIAPWRVAPYEWREVRCGLEDVFIHLMDRAKDNFAP